jgi:diguanylate cyclase (GGDEF)-like protein
MEWQEVSSNPLLITNYDLLSKIGILDYIEFIKKEQKETEDLVVEAYNIFIKESVDELISYLIECLSSKFIPSDLVFILNEGIMVNKIKTMAFKNLKSSEIDLGIDSLEEYEGFFRENTGTISYDFFEKEVLNKELIVPFKKVNAEIIIPINGLSGLYGIILFGPKILDKDYTDQEISYINRLMKFTSIGIQNNIHYEHSVKDSKTGLYNHNFFIHRVNEELSRAKRDKHNFSLMITDIDNFKMFNDKYGHLAGDEVIFQISKRLKKELREMDILSRFGGEEFTILLPNSNSRDAKSIAERIRKSIEGLVVPYNDETLHVTVSIGISTYNWFENINADDMLKRADDALYESKENGRNRSTLYRYGLLHRARQLKLDS